MERGARGGNNCLGDVEDRSGPGGAQRGIRMEVNLGRGVVELERRD